MPYCHQSISVSRPFGSSPDSLILPLSHSLYKFLSLDSISCGSREIDTYVSFFKIKKEKKFISSKRHTNLSAYVSPITELQWTKASCPVQYIQQQPPNIDEEVLIRQVLRFCRIGGLEDPNVDAKMLSVLKASEASVASGNHLQTY